MRNMRRLPVNEWFKELDEPEQTDALLLSNLFNNLHTNYSSLGDAVRFAFSWSYSSRYLMGVEYWAGIVKKYKANGKIQD